MKVTLYNHGKCGVYFMTEEEPWDCPFTFDNINDALAYVEQEIDYRMQAMSATVYDLETDVILAHCSAETPDEDDEPTDYEEPDEDWGYNEDMGYDPYMGCYTDDC